MWLDDLRPLILGPPGASRRLSEGAFRPFGISRVRTDAGAVEIRETVAATLPFGVLRTFTRADAGIANGSGTESGWHTHRKILVVAPLAGGYPFLLRDLVVALLGIADEVGITEWPNARFVPKSAGTFTLADNCIETAQMIRAMAGVFAAEKADAAEPEAPLHVIGICQGAVPALAATALLAETGPMPASLSLIGGPINPARNPTRLWRMLQNRAMEGLEDQVLETIAPAFPGAGRRVFPSWRQTDTFALYLWRQGMNGGSLPFQLTFDDGDDPWRYPLSRLCWTLMDVPAEFFSSNVATIFRANALAQGLLDIHGHRVRPQLLRRTALLTVEGEEDDISAPTQTEAAHGLCPNIPRRLHQHVLVPRAGHFALFYGQSMRQNVLPAIAQTQLLGEAEQINWA